MNQQQIFRLHSQFAAAAVSAAASIIRKFFFPMIVAFFRMLESIGRSERG